MKTAISVADFRPCKSGSLRGFIKLCIDGCYVVEGFKLVETNGRKWIAPPSKAFKKTDGSTGYVDTFTFASPDAKREFETAAMAALDLYMEREPQS